MENNINKDKEELSVAEIKAKYLNTKAYLRKHIRDEQIRRKTEELLSSPSPITEFKKVPGRNDVVCSLLDGTSYVIPVNHTLQLFFDKMEMHPDTVVDFGKERKNRVEILPYQNKIVYIDGNTNKVIRSLPIDSNLLYTKTDSITNNHIQIDSRLNPAILSILDKDLMAQKSYMNADGNIDIVYNFEQKSDKSKENFSNKKLVKAMNDYYKSEQKYAKEKETENSISQKIGYVNMLDKIQSNLTSSKSKSKEDSSKDDNLISFEKARKEFTDSLQINKSITLPKDFAQTQKTNTRDIGKAL